LTSRVSGASDLAEFAVRFTDLVGPEVVLKDCWPKDVKKEDSNPCKLAGRLRFSGRWGVAPTLDCEQDRLPKVLDVDDLPKFNYVRDDASWERKFSSSRDLVGSANGLRFGAEQNAEAVRGALALHKEAFNEVLVDARVCNELTGETGDQRCVLVRVTNGADDSDSAAEKDADEKNDYRRLLGASDPHFARYYDLIESPTIDRLWLPVLVGNDPCPPADGAGNPGPACSPAYK
jgi:hypothetical protein